MRLNKEEEKNFLRLKYECDLFLEKKELEYTDRNVIFFLTIKLAKLENKIKELEE
jgi:hypothetical protein